MIPSPQNTRTWTQCWAEWMKNEEKSSIISSLEPQQTPSWGLTCVACVSSPARRAGTSKGIAVVVAGASITAGGCVTLALTWPGLQRNTEVTRAHAAFIWLVITSVRNGNACVDIMETFQLSKHRKMCSMVALGPQQALNINTHINTVDITHGNGRSCPSSCRHTRSRSRSPGRHSVHHSYKGCVCTRRHLEEWYMIPSSVKVYSVKYKEM